VSAIARGLAGGYFAACPPFERGYFADLAAQDRSYHLAGASVKSNKWVARSRCDRLRAELPHGRYIFTQIARDSRFPYMATEIR